MKAAIKKLAMPLAMVIMAGCASLTPAEKAERAQNVTTALDKRHYKIDVRMMNPRRGTAKNVTSDWSLEVKGDTMVSYLPYIGRAYDIPYGGGKGLNFTARIDSYEESMVKAGLRRMVVKVTNDEDTYIYSIEVFNNGQTTIDVQPRKRESISYSGEMILEYKD